MSARRKAQRRLEIAALIEEGYGAFLSGKRETQNPYNPRLTMNGMHWSKGWDQAYRDSLEYAE